MKQLQPLNSKKILRTSVPFVKNVKQAFFSTIVVCMAAFFIQAEEDDEKGMYIMLAVIVVVVGLVNLVRWIFPKNHRRRGKDGHPPDSHRQHTRSDNGK